jgi:hypothetical protein
MSQFCCRQYQNQANPAPDSTDRPPGLWRCRDPIAGEPFRGGYARSNFGRGSDSCPHWDSSGLASQREMGFSSVGGPGRWPAGCNYFDLRWSDLTLPAEILAACAEGQPEVQPSKAWRSEESEDLQHAAQCRSAPAVAQATPHRPLKTPASAYPRTACTPQRLRQATQFVA